MFSSDDGQHLFFFDGSDLKKMTVNPDGSYATAVIDTGWAPGVKVAHVEINGEIFLSNGIKKARVSGGSVRSFSIEKPSATPAAASLSGGQMNAGRYKVAIVFVHSSGEESAASDYAYCEIANGDGIAVSGIPSPISGEISKVRIYASEANGQVLYRHAEIATGISSHNVMRSQTNGSMLRTGGLDEFPACGLLSDFGGRLFGAVGNILMHSEALRFSLIDMKENFTIANADIKLLAGVSDGIYVCSDKTYFLSGAKPSEWTWREVLPYSAVPGTLFESDDDEDVVGWFSEKGQIIAGPGGQVKNVTIDKVATDAYSSGASAMVSMNGIETIISTFKRGGADNILRCWDYAEAEVIRAS
jgi:hypothetical protein